jgi:hypothetical protein
VISELRDEIKEVTTALDIEFVGIVPDVIGDCKAIPNRSK